MQMKIRKQWSSNYQVVELEEEAVDLETARTIGRLMEDVAKEQLQLMIDTAKSVGDNNNNLKSVSVAPKGEGTLSPKQATTIKNQFKRAVSIANNLGIVLNSPQDVDNLTSKQASEIISEFFKGSKQDLGV